MSWSIAKPHELSAIIEFLKEREHTCVPFVSHLLKDDKPAFPSKIKKRIFKLESREYPGEIAGLVLQTTFGFVFPVLDTPTAERDPRLHELSRRLKKGLFHAVTMMGRDPDVARIEKIFGRAPDTRVVYYIMARLGGPPPRRTPPPSGYVFRRAGLSDLDALLPLQAAYEREEVIVDNREVNRNVVYHNMRSALESHLTYIAELPNGTPVAKAGTNARGLTYDQIGGVYTVPEERNKGIARELMRCVMDEVHAAGKNTTLFVKQHNDAAISMYRRLGFERKNDFAISYYHQ
ncbi:MAG: GNAT family N-acetyltransferase [Spirochaetota bacterium]